MRKCRVNPASGPFSRLGSMGRSRAILLALVLGLLAAATLSACGGEEDAELLPGGSAQEINANLDLVEQLVADGDCVGAANAAAAVREQVEALTGVDQKLQETLAAGANRLNEVVVECTEAPEEGETTNEEPDLEEIEREEKAAEKEAEKAEKEVEKEQKAEEKTEKEKETPPTEPPGQEKQEGEAEAPPSEEGGGTPSGGVSPSEAAGGAE
jgi:outer membrane biosynthesis protein TonB